jgi:hypothetical protein
LRLDRRHRHDDRHSRCAGLSSRARSSAAVHPALVGLLGELSTTHSFGDRSRRAGRCPGEVGNNKLRHETLQRLMLADCVTAAIEIPNGSRERTSQRLNDNAASNPLHTRAALCASSPVTSIFLHEQTDHPT